MGLVVAQHRDVCCVDDRYNDGVVGVDWNDTIHEEEVRDCFDGCCNRASVAVIVVVVVVVNNITIIIDQ